MRKEINEYIKSTKLDPTTHMILDLRQKNIKVSNNSIYGSLGYEKNLHFNKYVAASVSKLGRDNLTRVRDYFEECGHDIVGGDTDSIFVLKNNDQFYNQLEEYNKMIPPPLHIEEEKKYSILFLSTKKKRRFGIIKNKLEIKGYMTIRRDTALILKEVEQKVFDIILNNKDYGEKILEYCKNLIIENEEFDKFSITKTLKNTTEYRNISSPHCFLAKKLLNIGLLESIKSGDKIKYVHVKENWSNEIQTKNTGVRYCVATKELMKIKNLNIDYTKYRKDIYNMLWLMLEDIYDEKYGILLEKYLVK
jgi:DNA polymerase-2